MTYHYRQVPHEKREDLIEKAKKLIVDGGFKVLLSYSNVRSWAVNLCRDEHYLLHLKQIHLIHANIIPVLGWYRSLCFGNKTYR